MEEAPSPGRYTEPVNVLLFTVDTLRADHLSSFGHFRDTSPRIDALASEGLLFERAITTSATTLPAHLSIMTGLYPHQHGYVANIGAIKGAFESSPGRRTAAELFQSAGYATAAFVSGATVKTRTGLQTGFDVFDEPEEISRRGAVTTAHALAWLQEHLESDPDRPFFLWVHYWDPHEPNDPQEPWASLFRTDSALEALIDSRRVRPEVLQERFEPSEIARLFFPELFQAICIRREEAEVPPIDRDDVRRVYNHYDGDIRYTDDQVGRVLDTLDMLGLRDETVVALVADHGQALGQHDWLEHGSIEDSNLHVPMVVRFPGALVPQPARVGRVVSVVDLLPTIIARLDLPRASAFLDQASGADLLSSRFDRPYAFSHRTERARKTWESGREFALTFDRWKYYHLEEGEDQLFDLEADPGELVDVAAEHPDLVGKLRHLVQQTLSEKPWDGADASPDVVPDAQLRSELEALGYADGLDEDPGDEARPEDR